MMGVNIQELYSRYFNLPFPLVTALGPRVRIPSGVQATSRDEVSSEVMSMMGTPVLFPLQIGLFMFPDEPLVTVSGSNSIIKTKVQGLPGTVKEYVSQNDYSINIKGFLINHVSDEYPEELVRQLRDICEAKIHQTVKNKLLTLFNINYIVIEDYDFPAIEGFQNIQPFKIDAVSDRPVELKLRTT